MDTIRPALLGRLGNPFGWVVREGGCVCVARGYDISIGKPGSPGTGCWSAVSDFFNASTQLPGISEPGRKRSGRCRKVLMANSLSKSVDG